MNFSHFIFTGLMTASLTSLASNTQEPPVTGRTSCYDFSGTWRGKCNTTYNPQGGEDSPKVWEYQIVISQVECTSIVFDGNSFTFGASASRTSTEGGLEWLHINYVDWDPFVNSAFTFRHFMNRRPVDVSSSLIYWSAKDTYGRFGVKADNTIVMEETSLSTTVSPMTTMRTEDTTNCILTRR